MVMLMSKKKVRFLLLIVFLLIVLVLGYYVLYTVNYIPHKKYSNADFGIEPYISKVDMDQDGLDDQSDILEGVREYIATKPHYQSKYYDGGYPDDRNGVCTDVVSFGLLHAGYDLMNLVYEDIQENRDAYNIETVDRNIDFRRVRNLKVYFARNVISLTTDVSDIAEWQGGDIVVFENHIGIVSDYRNRNGVPFLIHNGSNFQRYYEEDVLEIRDDIVGHYRMS